MGKKCAALGTREAKQDCEGTKMMMGMGTGLLGCSMFVASQEEACVCLVPALPDQPGAFKVEL